MVPHTESGLGFMVIVMFPWADFEPHDRNLGSCFIHAGVLGA